MADSKFRAFASPPGDAVGDAVQDVTPPVLTSLVLPGEVSVIDRDATATVTVGASDSGSGASYAEIWFDRAYNNVNGYPLFYVEVTGLDSGSQSASIDFGPQTGTGPYIVSSVHLHDHAGNETDYSTAQLQALGFATSFTVDSNTAAEATPPELAFLAVSGVNRSGPDYGFVDVFAVRLMPAAGCNRSRSSLTGGKLAYRRGRRLRRRWALGHPLAQ